MCHVVVMLVCWRIPNCKRTVEVMEQHWPCYAMPWLFNMYTQLKDTRYSVTFLCMLCYYNKTKYPVGTPVCNI